MRKTYRDTIEVCRKYFGHDPYAHSLREPTFKLGEFLHSFIFDALRQINVDEKEIGTFHEWWNSKGGINLKNALERNLEEYLSNRKKPREVKVDGVPKIMSHAESRILAIGDFLSYKMNTHHILKNEGIKKVLMKKGISEDTADIIGKLLYNTPSGALHSLNQSFLVMDDPFSALAEALHAFFHSYHGDTITKPEHLNPDTPESKKQFIERGFEELVEAGLRQMEGTNIDPMCKTHELILSVLPGLKRRYGDTLNSKNLFLLGVVCITDPEIESKVTAETNPDELFRESLERHLDGQLRDASYLEGRIKDHLKTGNPTQLHGELRKLLVQAESPG